MAEEVVPQENNELVKAKESKEEGYSRFEAKARKALNKLGLPACPGVTRVTLRKGPSFLFVVTNCEAFGSGENYVIFGDHSIENIATQARNQAEYLEELKKLTENYNPENITQEDIAKSLEALKTNISEEEIVGDKPIEEKVVEIDSSKIDEKEVEIIMQQADCSRERAIEALVKNNYDVVNAIMSIV